MCINGQVKGNSRNLQATVTVRLSLLRNEFKILMSLKTISLFVFLDPPIFLLFCSTAAVRIKSHQSCYNRRDYCHSFSLCLPLLPVFFFLRSPLDLAALDLNWFSHLASAIWGMTATACPFCCLTWIWWLLRSVWQGPSHIQSKKLFFMEWCCDRSRLNKALMTA